MFIRERFQLGNSEITLETGRIAKQAAGSVIVSCGDTMVMVTVCGATEPRPGVDFLPLSVDYMEKTYAAGKIPGGFFKREGRLRNHEILVSRLIDRPCRPLFPDGYRNEIQVVATVLSHDQEHPSDMLALCGASAAIHLSPIPWSGPIGGVRVGRVDDQWVANPTYSELANSDCDLVIAASRDAIVMVEGEADELTEDELVQALFFGKDAIAPGIELMEQMREAAGKPKWHFEPEKRDPEIDRRVREMALRGVQGACSIAEKHERYGRFKAVKQEAAQALAEVFPEQDREVKDAYEELRYRTMRAQVLDEERRVDGRDFQTVRPIQIETSLLPRAHGSALFTRGETQAIVTATLGTTADEQKLDLLTGQEWVRFMLHYNFPPYSVGEIKFLRGPGRREIGHGNLAERALAKLMPSKEDFPYTIRVVSEITESNGSSSMASVCGGTLALMDAGVPIKAPAAGVAMGLISDGSRFAILTDILGDEDHLGDMDFKVCGTRKGITAIQMDIKIEGLSREIMTRALEQARQARFHILEQMQMALPAAREELSRHAPRITTIKVKPDQIRLVIGPGGKMIKAITEQTGCSIDIEDDGTIHIASADSTSVERAMELITGLTAEPEVGKTYKGIVKRVEPYGAFLEIMPGTDGLCHISDFAWERVEKTEDVMNLGDEIQVQVTDIDGDGRVRLSRKAVLPKPEGLELKEPARRGRERDRDRERERDRDRDRRPRRREREPRERDERRAAEGEERREARDEGRRESEERRRRDRDERRGRDRQDRPARDESRVREREDERDAESPSARDYDDRSDAESRPGYRDLDPEERRAREERGRDERRPRGERGRDERRPRGERGRDERRHREERGRDERRARDERGRDESRADERRERDDRYERDERYDRPERDDRYQREERYDRDDRYPREERRERNGRRGRDEWEERGPRSGSERRYRERDARPEGELLIDERSARDDDYERPERRGRDRDDVSARGRSESRRDADGYDDDLDDDRAARSEGERRARRRRPRRRRGAGDDGSSERSDSSNGR